MAGDIFLFLPCLCQEGECFHEERQGEAELLCIYSFSSEFKVN